MVIEWVAGGALLLILGVQSFLLGMVKAVRDELKSLNGSMQAMKQWQVLHEKSDDERHRDLSQGQRDLWQAVDKEDHP